MEWCSLHNSMGAQLVPNGTALPVVLENCKIGKGNVFVLTMSG